MKSTKQSRFGLKELKPNSVAIDTAKVVALCLLVASDSQAQTTTEAFVVTRLAMPAHWKLYEDGEDCPQGYNLGMRELYLQSIEDKVLFEKLQKNTALLTKEIEANADPDECITPENHEPAMMHHVAGRFAKGFDLDGARSGRQNSEFCAQKNFESPGALVANIDNQFYRAVGCLQAFRGKPGDGSYSNLLEDYHNGARLDGSMTMLLELSGIDSWSDDEQVQIRVTSSSDSLQFDAQNKPIAYQTYSLSDQGKHTTIGSGKIENGRFVSDSFEINLPFVWTAAVQEREGYALKGVRLALQKHPDGSVTGELGGYYDVEKAYHTYFAHGLPRSQVLAASFGFQCPAVYRALKTLADGFPDKSGNCTAISTYYEMDVTPAFIAEQ